MTCANCIHHARDWRLCLHPESQDTGFWRDPQDYTCHTPGEPVEDPKPTPKPILYSKQGTGTLPTSL